MMICEQSATKSQVDTFSPDILAQHSAKSHALKHI